VRGPCRPSAVRGSRPTAQVTSSSDASAGQQLSPRPAPDSEAGGALLAEWVGVRRFSTTRLRPGYDQEDVDAFRTEIRDSFLGARQPSLTPDEIRSRWSRSPACGLVTTLKRLTPSSMRPDRGCLLFTRKGTDGLGYYKDSAFPACPACGSPNAMVTESRTGQGHYYLCLEPGLQARGAVRGPGQRWRRAAQGEGEDVRLPRGSCRSHTGDARSHTQPVSALTQIGLSGWENVGGRG